MKKNVLALKIKSMFMVLQFFNFQVAFSDSDDIFRQDIGDKMEIGLTDKGYKSVELKCGAESMIVHLETEDEFLGVIYTRGSFYNKEPHCFFDTGSRRGQKSFKMTIAFNECKTEQEGNIYSNVLILQHDKELIMPGDAAFNLECDFDKSRDVTVTADLHSTSIVTSRITLVDADPAKQIERSDRKGTFESYTNSVIITPETLRSRREEL